MAGLEQWLILVVITTVVCRSINVRYCVIVLISIDAAFSEMKFGAFSLVENLLRNLRSFVIICSQLHAEF